MDSLPVFDEIYVISDIHMGGRPGFQILRHWERLGRFIEHLGGVRSGEKVALVLNGDVIDSLAEEIHGYVATREAVGMMDRIYANFMPVWEGLASFIRQPGRHLIWVTGNHDIELSLPEVEYSIRQRIAGGDTALNGAMTFATKGAGYACYVGDARVFCTHGNEVDDWNIVDYGRLGELGNALNAGCDIDHKRWSPNAGTKLVVDVMNLVKRQYPFVDLLKPETKVVVPILLVLDPSLAHHIDVESAFGVTWGKLKGQFIRRGLLGAEDEAPSAVRNPGDAAELALNELLGGHLLSLVSDGGESTKANADDLLLEAEAVVRGEHITAQLDDDEGTLGWFGMALDRLRGVDKVEALRNALLDWLQNDESFRIGNQDETFERIATRVDPTVDIIVTGHTHLERAIPMGDRRFYYNCGTWIRLIRFTEEMLNKPEQFQNVMEAIEQGSMQALDEASLDGEPLVLDRSAAVRIAVDGQGVCAELLRVGDDGNNGITLDQVPNTEFRKP